MHVPLAALHQNLFGAIDAFALLAVPFFIYAGELMSRGSVAQRIVDFVQAGVGRVPGSLGVTAVGTSAIFGAISGASAATVATVGKAMLPPMRQGGLPGDLLRRPDHRRGRDRHHHPAVDPDDRLRHRRAGVRAAPLCGRRAARAADRRDDRDLRRVVREAPRLRARPRVFTSANSAKRSARGIWALGAPFIILGGIYGGVFSPTEAAAVACVYAALVHLARVPRARLARRAGGRRRPRRSSPARC